MIDGAAKGKDERKDERKEVPDQESQLKKAKLDFLYFYFCRNDSTDVEGRCGGVRQNEKQGGRGMHLKLG